MRQGFRFSVCLCVCLCKTLLQSARQCGSFSAPCCFAGYPDFLQLMLPAQCNFTLGTPSCLENDNGLSIFTVSYSKSHKLNNLVIPPPPQKKKKKKKKKEKERKETKKRKKIRKKNKKKQKKNTIKKKKTNKKRPNRECVVSMCF